MHGFIAKLAQVTKKTGANGIWALIDQGLISLGTFTVGIILARTLPAMEYGVFALILGILFFLNAVHSGLITYPLSIKGATLSEGELGELVGAKVVWTLIISVPLAVVMAAAVYVVSEPVYIPMTVLAVIAWQFHETARRALMTHLRHKDLLLGDGLKFGGWALTVAVLTFTGHATIGSIFGALALLSLIAGVLQCWQVSVRFARNMDLRRIGYEAWRLGHMILIGGLLTFSLIPFYNWVLMFFHNPEFSAQLQSLVLVLGVTHPILYSINNILVPAVSRAERTEGRLAGWMTWLSYGGTGALLMLPYMFGLMLFPALALNLFFGSSSPYAALTDELRLWSLTYMLLYASQLMMGLLGGFRQVRAGFISQIAASAVMVLAGVPLIAQHGVVGACIAGSLTFGIQVLIQISYLCLPERLPWSEPLPLDGRQPSSEKQTV